MDTKKLRQKILDLAIHGKLVPQDPNDEPASVLLERIRAEKEQLIKEGKIKAPKKSKSAGDTFHYQHQMPWELPEGWVWSTLGDFLNLQAGKFIQASDIHDKSPQYPYPCYGGNGIRGFVSSYNRMGSFPIVGRQGALCGNINYASGKFYATEHAVVVETYGGTNVDWARYLLEGLNLNQYATATAQPGLSVKTINEVPIPIPPVKEQSRIAVCLQASLESVEQIEELTTSLCFSVSETKSKILDLAIHGKLVPQDPSDEPAIELLKRINPDFKPSDNLHYETQQLFSLPKGWEWCSVKDYTKKVTDYVASGSFASLKENVRYYKSPNYAILVKTKDFANNFSEDLTYTDEHGYNFLENSHLYGGELIFSNVGSVGKIFKVPKMNMRMSLAPNAIMVKFHQDEQASWFERVFQSPFGQESLRAIASATAIMKFNKTDFGKLLIPVPPVSEQKRILNAIEALFVQLNCIYDTE